MEEKIINDYLDAKLNIKAIREKYNISRQKLEKLLKSKLTKKQLEIRRKTKVIIKLPKHIGLIGKKFNHLTIIDVRKTIKSTDGSNRFICKCDCGRDADISTNYLIRGIAKTCGNNKCEFRRQDANNNGNKNINFKGYKEISGAKFNHIRNGAKKRGLIFDITLEYIWNLFISQNRKCALTDRAIYFGKTNTQETIASLDRIDSSKGYVEGNVQWVHKTLNIMKWGISLNEFINICGEVINKHKIK